MDLPDDVRGALVSAVTRNGPAAKAGLRGGTQQIQVDGDAIPVGGDLIVGIDDKTVKTMEDLIAYLVDSTSPGDTVSLTILRDGKERTVDVTLGTRPSAQEVAPQ
jgi:2-alkenal reductase